MPGPADDAVVNLAGAQVEFSVGTNVVRSFTASRPFTVSGGLLMATNGFTLNSTIFTLTGGTLDVTNQGTINGGTTFLQAGQIVGQLRVVNGGVIFATNATIAGEVRFNGSINTLSGDVPAAMTVWVEGRAATSTGILNVTNHLVNRGVIQLETTASTLNSSLVVNPGFTLTNAATGLIVANHGTGGSRPFAGSIVNLGTLMVQTNATASFSSAMLLENSGSITVQSNGTATFGGFGSQLTQKAGVIRGDGEFRWSGGTVSVQGGRLEGLVRADGARIAVGGSLSEASTLRLVGSLCYLASNSSPAMTLWVEGRPADSTAVLNVTNNTVNRGTLRLETTSSTFSSSLSITAGNALTNEAGGVVQAQLGTGGPRSISGALVNSGTLLAASNVTFNLNGRVEQQGGVIRGEGEVRLSGNTFEIRGGRLEGMVRADSTRIAVAETVTEASTLRAVGATCALLSNAAPMMTIWVEGRSADSTGVLNVTNNTFNRGTLRLETSASTFTSALTVSAGNTLTNEPGGLILANPGTGGGRTISGTLANWGTIRTETNATLNLNSRLDQRGGVVRGDGEVRLSGSSFEFVGGKLEGTVRADSTRIAVSDTMTNASTLRVVGSGCQLSSNSSPAMTLWVEGRSSDSTGVLNVTNNTVNRGTIHLETTASTFASAVTVSAGNALTNEATGTIQGAPGTGGPRTLNGSYVNFGTLRAITNASVAVFGSLKQQAGVIQGDGEFRVSSGPFEFNGGRLEGIVRAAGVIAVAESVTEASTLRAVGTGCYLASNASPAVTVWVEGRSADSTALLNVTNSTVNRGIIKLETTASTFGSLLTVTAGNVLTNAPDATIQIAAGTGGSRSLTGAFENQGTFDVGTNATVILSGGPFINAVDGLITGLGTITLSGSTFTNHGTVAPGSSPGLLSFSGNYVQSPSGRLDIEIGGTNVGSQYDRFAIAGTATLDGTLQVRLLDNYVPAVSNSFRVLTFTSRSGDFASYSGLAAFTNLSFAATYVSTGLNLVVYTDTNQVAEPPTIAKHPQGQSVINGQTASFSVTANGTRPFAYQWQFNSTNLPNATNAALVLANAQTNQSGPYRVVVTNSSGSITSAVATLTVSPVADLVVTEIAHPTNAFAGQPFAVTWRSLNQGSQTATAPWTETIGIATNASGAPLTLLGSVVSAASLAGGSSIVRTQTVILPGGLDGTFYIVISTDTGNQVVELLNETNNTAVSPLAVTVRSPDLQPVELSVPASATYGESISISWAVTNAGGAPVLAAWNDRIYLSTNAGSLSGALALGTIANTNHPFASGAARTNSANLTLPLTPEWTPGGRFLIIETDFGNAIAEVNETNNRFAAPITLSLPPQPDFVVGNVVGPSNLLSAQLVPVSWVVTNIGSVSVTSVWTETVFLATNAAGAGLTELGTFWFTNTLAAGATLARTQAVVIPATAPTGDVWFAVQTDSRNDVFEGGEGNNLGVATGSSLLPPMLTLQLTASQLTEGATSLATITRNGPRASPLSVAINSGDLTELSAPTNVVSAAGQASASFIISALADGIVDGPQIVSLTASAPGFTNAAANVTVLDADLPELTLTVVTNVVTEGLTLGATISRDAGTNAALIVKLSSSNPGQLLPPISVTIPAGQFSHSFALLAVNDAVVELPAAYTVIASATNHISGAVIVNVLDDDLPAVTLSFPVTNISESAGPQAALGTLFRTPVPDAPLYIELESDTPGSLVVPSLVTIPASQASATFPVAAVDNALLDSNRVVEVRAWVKTSPLGTRVAQLTPATLTVTDDEGPALKLTLAQSLVPEGANPATTATITRNTGTNSALVVNLSSSLANEATVPFSVTIPAGALATNFTVATPTDGITDGNKAVTLSAEAAGFAGASVVLTVTDTDKPDLVISSITAPSFADTEAFVSIGYQLRNQGLAAMPSNIVVQRISLSSDSVPGGDVALGEFVFNGALSAGGQIGQAFSIRMPQTPGTYWIIVETDVQNAVDEILEDNNTRVSATPIVIQPAYSAVVSTTLESAPANVPVPLVGSAFRTNSAPVPFALVNIHINVRGTHRVIAALTDSSGNFAVTWQPLPGEAGFYEIGAAHPGYTNAATQDSFSLFGMNALPVASVVQLAGTGSVTGVVAVANAGDLALSGINAQVLSPPPNLNFNLTVATNALPGLATNTLTYTLNSTDGLAAQGTVVVRLSSAEGAVLDVPFTIGVKPLTPQLAVSPATLVRGIKRGVQSFASFTVTNVGGAATGPVSVSLPPVAWMTLASTNPLPSLAPGEGINVALQLTPPTNLALGTFNGQLWLGGGAGAMSVPFEFRVLSEEKGALRVTAADEFTFYAAGAPKLTNAAITLRDAVSGALVTNGITGADGTWSLAALTEGYYTIEATAEKHAAYKGTHLVLAGVTNDVSAFLSRQTVRYTWTVVPTEIEDHYRIVVETEFEANVPAPVVTVTPSVIDLDELEDEMQVNLVIENHGLIAAQDFELQFDEHDSIVFEPLVSRLGTLPAKSTFTVPLTIRRTSNVAARHTLAQRIGHCLATGRTVHHFSCGGVDNIQFTTLTFPNAGDCVPPISLPALPWLPQPSGSIPRTYPCYDCGGGERHTFKGFQYTSSGGGFGITISDQLIAAIYEALPSLAIPNPCDPECLPKLIPAVKDCVESLIPSKPYDDCKKGVADCAKTSYQSPGVAAAYSCFKAALSCSEAAGKTIPGPWKWLPVLDCAYGMLSACADEESARPAGTAGRPLPRSFTFAGRYAGLLNTLLTRVQRMEKVDDSYAYYYGDGVWFQSEDQTAVGNFMELFGVVIESASDAGSTVSAAELTLLLAQPLPPGVGTNHVHHLVERWNRTMNYWGAGIFNLAQVPSGDSTDFLALDEWDRLSNLAKDAIVASETEGHASLAAGLNTARDELVAVLTAESGGVCARVKLRLDQEAVLSRDAFKATLEIDNADGAPLENLYVTLGVFDEDGNDASELFGITSPELTGIIGTNGNGLIGSNQTGRLTWTLVPAPDAAPTDSKRYFVSGGLNYIVEDNPVSVPLSPATIAVLPTPRLSVKYFHQRDVFSDDPYTDVVEPAVPFSLAVMVRNSGFGTAKNFRLTSAQPEIVDNEKGLLIDFKIIATEVAGKNLVPSLTAELGDIGPGTNAIARWLMTSTLQGLFTDYKASFEHVDSLGNPKLSLIEDLSIHEMIHVVDARGTFADGRPDFLVNDIPDVRDLPDTFYLSDGSTNHVQVVTNGNITGTLSPGNLQVTLTAALPLGWSYLRIPDPGNGQYQLVGVTRSDSSVILVNTNAWVTDRTFLGLSKKPVRENNLHLLDYDSTGSYTLTFAALPAPDTIAPTSSVAALPSNSRANIPLSWSGADELGSSGLASFDVYVSENSGPFNRWLTAATTTSAIFPGLFGNSYAFYSVAVDQSGNREPAPLAPDTQTTVTLTNQPPVLAAISNRVIIEGQTLALAASASDPDGDALTFALGAGAPAGMVLNSANGQLFWSTGESDGPGTNVITLFVRDSGVPFLSATQSFTVIMLETNSPPALASIPNETVSEGQLLTFIATAFDTDLPAQKLTFILGTGAPEGAAINSTNGVFTWTPASFQGGVTNLIAVIVTDDGVPAMSATQTLAVVVLDSSPDFRMNLATTALLSGASGSLALTVNSGTDLTNLSAIIAISGNRLTNLSLQSIAPSVAAAEVQALGSNQFDLRFRSQSGGVLQGDFTIAQLAFDTTPDAHSAVVRLDGVGLSGRRTTGALLADGRIAGARVFVVGLEPILDPFPTNQLLGLVLYAQPGNTYALERRSSLPATNAWSVVTNVEPATLQSWLSPQPMLQPMEFFRMVRPSNEAAGIVPVAVVIQPLVTNNQFALRISANGDQTVSVEWTPGLAPANWQVLTNMMVSTNSQLEVFDPLNATQRFYRVRFLAP